MGYMMEHSSKVEISRSAYRQNLRFLRSIIGPETLFSSVIKGNAYGHGIEVFVPMAEECGVRHFSVFSAEEAYAADRVRRLGTDLLILGYIDDTQLEWAVERGIAFYVFDLPRLEGALQAAGKVGGVARIHLEIETGMNRTGFEDAALGDALELILAHPDRLCVDGVCTHLAGAESIANDYRIRNQLHVFSESRIALAKRGLVPRLAHAAGSAAAFNYPDSKLDMVRIGIAQYGYWPNQESRMRYLIRSAEAKGDTTRTVLKGVLRWSSRIMGLKQARRGDFVGYGNAFQAMRDLTLAAVPVGYSHGFPRSLSNLGYVLVHGRRAPVVGYVSMNMMMIDVTDCPGVHRGDEVVIIGSQKRARITVSSFSDMINYVNYEILTRIPPSIPRSVVE
ncbi:alanine racemase [Candidatus Fermentibacteria bacterium]|nr:alanine racemase [Candidatus Fermentibacteria bacterium]